MALKNLNDDELKKILKTKGGLGEFLKDQKNLSKFIGFDASAIKRIQKILKAEGLSEADIKKRIDAMAYIHSSVTDFF